MRLPEAMEALAGLEAAAGPARPGQVHLSTQGTVARLILDNPGARGALTFRMMQELGEAVRRLSTWEGALVRVVSTDPRAFCAGGHLGQVRRGVQDAEGAATMARAMTAILDELAALPQVSVAQVDGPAIGGGAELLTACDLRVFGTMGRIHFVHGRLGIAPGWGGTARLVGIVGRQRALQILLRAEALGPDDALAWGLADRVGAQAAPEVDQLLGGLGTLAPEAVRALKRQVAGGDAVEAFAGVWGGPAHLAALAALRGHD